MINLVESLAWFSLWHATIFAEAALLVILHLRRTSLKWFESLIAVDLVANIAQVILYRIGYREFSRLMWIGGVALLAPLYPLAISEAARRLSTARTRAASLHLNLLACWVSLQLACAYLSTQPGWNHGVNHVLLTGNLLAFVIWCAMW